jgi:CRISPR-associated protein Cmr2
MNKCEFIAQEEKVSEVKNIYDYISYCKQYKLFNQENIKLYINPENINKLVSKFPFLKSEIDTKNYKNDKVKKYRNDKLENFPLNWLKDTYCKSDKPINIEKKYISTIQNISGIIENKDKVSEIVKRLPTYSFILWSEFELNNPYFSQDDDNFYLIQNPVLKEQTFKIPMIRGSSWKGSLASAFKDIINGEKDKIKVIESYFRIFGAGSESIKNLENYFKNKSEKEGLTNLENKDINQKIVELLLFELGLTLNKEEIDKIKNGDIVDVLTEWLTSKSKDYIIKSKLPPELSTHKGRAVFYPTYFDKISLEVINPHDRRKRAGKAPIFYEVVPKGSKGILQIVYIPFDLSANKDEIGSDINYLINAIERLTNKGIGAKTKLGWGSYKLKSKYYYIANNNIDIKNDGWRVVNNESK